MKFAFITTSILTLAASLSAQEPTRSQQLNRSVATLFQNGKYDDAIPLAEEIVGLERKEGSSGKNLINALENLALIELFRFKLSHAELAAGTLAPSAIKPTVEKWRRAAERCESSLREAMRLADLDPQAFWQQRISVRNSLAWILYNYQPPDPDMMIDFDKASRDKFEMRSKARFFARVNEADKTYQEALKIASSDADANDNSALLTTYNLAQFALDMGDLENSIARFEMCISEVERIYGNDSRDLAPPLEAYIKVLVATGQEDAANEMGNRLARVTGKPAGLPKTLLNLSLRADKAFAPANSTGIEGKARANKEVAALAGRRATMEADFNAMLAVSTNGREYYESGSSVRVSKVPVRVVVDESGRVSEADALTGDKEAKRDAETAVREWKFKPFISGGQARKLTGYVECIVLVNRLTK